jgi:hypothetical protein
MKKLILLALVVILLPMAAQAYELRDGDPAFIFQFVGDGTTLEVIMGETWCDYLYVANYAVRDINGTSCNGRLDTMAVVTTDLQGWPITNVFDYYVDANLLGENANGVCMLFEDTCTIAGGNCTFGDPADTILHVSWLYEVLVCIDVPCNQGDLTGQLNTLTGQIAYCDVTMTAQPDTSDCEDPNTRNPYSWAGETAPVDVYSMTSISFEVIASPPPLSIFQDTLYFVEEGVTQAYVPFSLCNGDLCAGISDYDYLITSNGTVGTALSQTGTVTGVGPGECADVYAIVDAGSAVACTYDTLKIVAWDVATGLTYDTCVQAIHVVEPVPVPLFTAPVVTILVLAMILAAAVIMKRHAVSKV